MPARAIGRWVGRAAVFATLGFGFWAVTGVVNAGGAGAATVSGHAASGDGWSDLSGNESEVTTMDFEWN